MADSAATAHSATAHSRPGDVFERDLLKLVTGSAAAMGVGAIAWSFLDYMNTAADLPALSTLALSTLALSTLALSTVEVDPAPVEAGSGITVAWRGKPIVVRHRTPQEIKQARNVQPAGLIEPQPDCARAKPGHAEWIVGVGIGTHPGRVPLGKKPTAPRGDWGGWFCSRHGSQYDMSGRVRHGPAPADRALPSDDFDSNTKIMIG